MVKLIQRSLIISLAALACACSQQPVKELEPPQREFEVQLQEDGILDVYDPLEPVNRAVYNFNSGFDRYVFLPALNGYRAITPDPVENSVSNFFANLREMKYLANNLLQGELKSSAITLGRFAVNTTVGLLGLFDPATPMGLNPQEEDFGQTLGAWGVGDGPYLVLPFFGPSNLRDTGGLITDAVAETNIDLFDWKDDSNRDDYRVAFTLLRAIDIRKNTAFRYYETGSPFEYELVRYAYTRVREEQIKK
jgi:phospholipid-binding lipoprotein MlaA